MLHRTTSQQMLMESSQVTANPDIFSTKLTIPRSSTFVQKQKVDFRTRHKNRTLSTDPRFKCDRMSGGQNEVMYTHSETILTPIGTPSPRKLKIHSNPIFTIEENKGEIVTPNKMVIETIGDILFILRVGSCNLLRQEKD